MDFVPEIGAGNFNACHGDKFTPLAGGLPTVKAGDCVVVAERNGAQTFRLGKRKQLFGGVAAVGAMGVGV